MEKCLVKFILQKVALTAGWKKDGSRLESRMRKNNGEFLLFVFIVIAITKVVQRSGKHGLVLRE